MKLSSIVGASAAIGIAVGVGLTIAAQDPRPPPPPAAPVTCDLPALRAECDATCAPLRSRWLAAADGTTVILKCGCEEPPNVGVYPLKKRKRG